MNLEHLKAFCWLRWRLLANQVTKGGILNQILLFLVTIGVALGAISVFIGGLLVGAILFSTVEVPSWVMLLIWDVLILAFLFWWSIGLLAELQRSEAFSLDKFLHLPVSLSGVFVLNYLSSLMSVNLVMFVPMTVGFSLGLVISHGPAMLLLLPLLAAFFLMVTALTYQLQGWLASLMANKRRRRTIIVFITAGFVLLFQAPNLINLYVKPWKLGNDLDQQQAIKEFDRKLAAKEITNEEYAKQTLKMRQEATQNQAKRGREMAKQAEDLMWIGSTVLPPGWLAVGAWAASEGNVLPGLLGVLGMSLIGVASLWRAYKTTLRLYTGQFNAGVAATKPRPAPTEPTKTGPPQPASAGFLEKQIRGVSEPAAVIALATFRSLTRAPEGKMLLLSPIIMLLVFGAIFWQTDLSVPDPLRPLVALGAIWVIMLTMMGLLSNQFGYDRSGFKIYILSPVLRRDILLGKNLAIVPVTALLTLPTLLAVEIMMPMPIGYLLALPFQFLTIFLLICLPANVLSIIAPLGVAAGTMKPMNPKVIPVLLHVLMLFVLPILMAPVVLPWGIQAGLEALDFVDGIPICLILSALESIVMIFVYRWSLGWQGRMLQWRELKILEAVVTKTE